MKRKYELVVILDSEIKTADQEETLSRIKRIILDVKGDLSSTKDWGKKEFMYPINKKPSGVYILFEYEAEPQTAEIIKQKLQLEEKIVRYLLTVVEGKKNVVKVA